MTESNNQDPNFCGLDFNPSGPNLTTGPDDPWWKRACVPHDQAFEALKQSEWSVFGTFTKNIAIGMAQGAFMLLTGPLYWIVGGIGGIFRYQQLENRNNPKPPNDSLGDDI